MKNSTQLEGIVLSSWAFGEEDRLACLFTKERGKIKVIARKAQSSRQMVKQGVTPLSQISFTARRRRGDFFLLEESKTLRSYLGLRRGFERLQAAQYIVNTIDQTQLIEKAAPSLYDLLQRSLQQIHKGASPPAIALCFLFKTLQHEGLLDLSLCCAHCQRPSSPLFHAEGEWYCPHHTPYGALPFLAEEQTLLQTLLQARSFQTVCTHHTLAHQVFEKMKKQKANLFFHF